MAELFDESHYFVCSQGLKPSAFKAGQKITKRSDDKYYLTEHSLTTYNGDFSCKWIALLAAVLVALILVLCSTPVGWILLAAIAGAAVGAAGGMALCGHKAAVARVWLVIKVDAQIGDKKRVANKTSPQLTCSAMGGSITYAPNIKSEFHALVIFAGNVAMTGLEGFMYAYAARGIGMLVTKPLTFFANFGVNYLKTLSIQGIGMRGLFGAWGGFSAYSTSETEMTVTEGLQSEEVQGAAKGGFFFAETAAEYAVTTGDPQSIALLLSMGGIPGSKGDYSTTKELFKNTKDNFYTDRAMLKMELAKEFRSTKQGWKNAAEKTKAQVSKTVEAAKEFRNKLRQKKKGTGAHEIGVAAKMKIAFDFYKKMNPDLTDRQIKSHMNGIDFAKPIEIVDIGEGKQLFQYTKVNTEGTVLKGDYYTDNPNNTPSELGVSDKYSVRDPNNGWEQTDQVNTVQQETITIENNVKGLKSTSAEINDTWSLKGESVPTEGGGSQIYIPKNQ